MRLLLLLLLALGCAERPMAVDRTEFAFGSYVRVRLDASNQATADSATQAVFRRLHQLDTLWSSFPGGSELARVNKTGRERVSPGTRELVAAALRLAGETSGALDITVGPLVCAWGFHDSVNRVPGDNELVGLLARVGSGRVVLRADSVLLEPGTVLDFGALAVGAAVDEVVGLARDAGAIAGLVDAGGDIRVFGDRDWRIGVRHPRADSVMRVLVLRDRAVATSGDYQKFFEAGGRRWCHIFDPRTGRPASGCASVTVVAPTALTADAWSTALFVLGPDGLELVRGLDSIAVLMVCPAGDSLVDYTAGILP
ncbi:FAD:protein FMN transferase [candidate division WOR-3 bacterium]|nr:FAD:protein FMN transferase [candidate division WOR-3 bacterium]